MEPDLCVWSYEVGEAKPSPELFRRLSERLEASRKLSPRECLYVGNDMLNDISAAAAAGYRTALFAGDARSLRLRAGDPRCSDVHPDVTITRLGDILDVVNNKGGDR